MSVNKVRDAMLVERRRALDASRLLLAPLI
jgi:hypothetical protein